MQETLAFADLHIHSMFSDGSYTPQEIVSRARSSGVGLISVTDHNLIEGTLQAREAAAQAGIGYVCGVEIDGLLDDFDVHILCYGADLTDAALLERIRHARARLDNMNDALLECMLPDHPELSAEDYAAFTHDSSLGGWKMLQYLKARGLTARLHDGFPFYERYGITYQAAGFDSVEDVIRAIHGADGAAVLAHPGVTFPHEDLRAFEAMVSRAAEPGFDGIECYYPAHDCNLRGCCLNICERRGMFVTAGSDCHGAFNRNRIGGTQTPISKVTLPEKYIGR